MSVKALSRMGAWRGLEGAYEVTIPMFSVGISWYFAYSVLSAPSPGRPLSVLEVWALLGVCVAITSWFMARNLFMARKRSPWTIGITAVIVSLGLAWVMGTQVTGAFERSCLDPFEGEIIELTSLEEGDGFGFGAPTGGTACRMGGVPDNPYLVGTVFRPSWDARWSVPLLMYLAFIALLSALGFRSLRLAPTKISYKLVGLLRFAPAAGIATAMGKPKPKAGGKVVACTNATLWGETCGQIYSAEKEWYPGEWCQRCEQPFTPALRTFTFKIVSLFTGDVDVLNGIERIDTVSWPRGEPIAPDGRISGQERWVTLGTLEFPETITVAQVLSMVHDMVPKWAASDDVRVKVAGRVAQQRASKISCWFWRGSLSHRLTYARPNAEAILGIGPQRLSDLIEDASEELWLQLDIGLLPVEVRTGFKKTFVEEGRRPELQNSKFDLWVPVSNPKAPKEGVGLWVPRVEGSAFRQWLSTDQLRDDSIKGVSTPLPYLRYDPQNRGRPPEGHDRSPKAGTLDFARYELGPGGMEPVVERAIGASLAEWDWLEWRQVELLRREALVLE